MTTEEQNQELKDCVVELLQCIRPEDHPMVVDHARTVLKGDPKWLWKMIGPV